MAKGESFGRSIARLVFAFGMATAIGVASGARADWFSENFELHGKAYSQVYFNAPSLSQDIVMSQWWNAVEMNFDIRLFEDSNSSLTFHSIITPTYDAAYDLYPKYWGDRRKDARGVTQADFLGGNFPITQIAPNARDAMRGEQFDGHGACIKGAFCDTNQDTAWVFTNKNNPQMVFDDTIFFGILGAASSPRDSDQGKLGGHASARAFEIAAKRLTALGLGPAAEGAVDGAGTSALLGSLTLAGRNSTKPIYSAGSGTYGNATGDRRSIEQQFPVGINHTEGQLKTRCFDGVHDWCWAREAYFELKYDDTQLRIGRQQVVWGKTDAFRLQDIVNPIAFDSHNVYPSLEDRRIPSLSADLIQSFGTVGPLEDVSLEIVWVFDRFKPVQVGQCGDAWAFTAACEARADVGAHGLLNQSAARVEQRDWNLANTEPGFRFEFRIPEPSIAFSISGFWGFQDAPVARFVNHYSENNPNPAMMLFLQSLGFGGIIPAFNPHDQASVMSASNTALGTWGAFFGDGGVLCDAAAQTGPQHAECIAGTPGLQLLGWIWSASQAVIEYPRTFTLGGSLDYQIPNVDTVLRLEAAYDFGRQINNTLEYDGMDDSDVIMAAIGLDRSFFIPILNKDRTAFVSFQTFAEHVLDHEGTRQHGFVVPETNVISTFFIENYWRGDSIVLTNFFAYDWNARAWITGPKLKWVMNDKISFEVGINLLQGSKKEHNIRDICQDSSLDCLGDPTSWNPGNWQLINEDFRQNAEAPFWGLQSFADGMMEDRDEIWAGVTYQF